MSLWRKESDPPPAKDEHFVPSRGLTLEEYARRGDVQGAHHLARYEWLLEVLTGRERRLLDLGCGAGYGSFLIAERHPLTQVVAVDYDPVALSRVRETYRRPNLRVAEADAMTWAVPELAGQFDAIVSFDSLEHVPHRELVLEQIVEHLEPGGALYLSTPCAWAANDLSPEWPAHRIEYCTASLFDFLSRYFRVLVRPEDHGFPGRNVFERLWSLGIEYPPRCNPVICREPIRIANPYRPEADGGWTQGV